MVFFPRDRLALHHHIDAPRTGACDPVFEGRTHSGRVIALLPAGARRAEEHHVAALEIRLLLPHVAKIGHHQLRGAATGIVGILKALDGRGEAAAVVVERDVAAEQTVVVAEASGETCGRRVEEQKVGVEAGSVGENDAGEKFRGLFRDGVDHAHTAGAARDGVVQDRLDDGVWPEREPAGGGRGGKRGGVGTEVGAKGATAVAEVAGLTLAAVLREVLRLGRGEVGAAALDHVATGEGAHDFTLRVFLDVVHFPCGEKFAVGQGLEAVVVAADAGEALDVGIPRREFVVSDRPLTKAVAGRSFEIKAAPALRLAGPDEGFAADLVAANPVEGPVLHVGMLVVFDEEVRGGFVKGVAFFRDGIRGDDGAGGLVAVRELPRVFQRGRIVVAVFHVAAALQDKRAQAGLAEFLRRPAAADAGADDDGVKCVLARAGSRGVIRHRERVEATGANFSSPRRGRGRLDRQFKRDDRDGFVAAVFDGDFVPAVAEERDGETVVVAGMFGAVVREGTAGE